MPLNTLGDVHSYFQLFALSQNKQKRNLYQNNHLFVYISYHRSVRKHCLRRKLSSRVVGVTWTSNKVNIPRWMFKTAYNFNSCVSTLGHVKYLWKVYCILIKMRYRTIKTRYGVITVGSPCVAVLILVQRSVYSHSTLLEVYIFNVTNN